MAIHRCLPTKHGSSKLKYERRKKTISLVDSGEIVGCQKKMIATTTITTHSAIRYRLCVSLPTVRQENKRNA